METEQNKFMRLAYSRTLAAARKAFRSWHSRKKEDAIQETLTKIWDQWIRLVQRGGNELCMVSPEPSYCRELCMVFPEPVYGVPGTRNPEPQLCKVSPEPRVPGTPEPRLHRYGKQVGPLTPGTVWTF